MATNTFVVDAAHGRSRAVRQDGDSTELIQEAIDTCPVDCIHWVLFEELDPLNEELSEQIIQPPGIPRPAGQQRLKPRSRARHP